MDENTSLSSKIWGIDWKIHFPKTLGQEANEIIQVKSSDFIAANRFMMENYTIINQLDPHQKNLGHNQQPDSLNKKNYYQVAGDFLSIHANDETIGFFTGTVLDWSSYYFRNIAIFPQYQRKMILQKLLAEIIPLLKQHNVAKIETDISSTNLGQIHLMNKLKFNITGFTISECWGGLVHFTKFLNQQSLEHYIHQYCYGVSPQLTKPEESLI